MKNLFKTILTLLLALVMVFTVVGCGNSKTESDPNAINDDFFTEEETNTIDNSDSGTSGEGTTNKPTSSGWKAMLETMPKSLRGSKIKLVNWNPISEYTGAAAAIKEFESQTGIKVEWITVDYGVYFTRLATMVASDEAPDVVRTLGPNPTNLQSFQSIKASGYDFSDDAWDKTLMDDYTFNGVTYATSLKGTHIGSVNMMFYNKDLISRYDYEDPYKLWKSGKWTVNKFIEMCKNFKKDSGEQFACTGSGWGTFTSLYGIEGPVSYDGQKYVNNLSNNQFLTVTQKVADWFNKDSLLASGRAEFFNAGDALFYSGASIYLRRNNSYFGTLKSNGTLYAVPMPSVDGQGTYYQGKDEYEAYAIPRGAKNAAAVPYFLRYFLDPENYDMDAFYCNKQNLEVYNWCMSQKNTIWTTGYASESDTFFGKDGLASAQGNQVKSFIDTNAYMIDNRVKNLNKLLSQLQK